MSSKGKLIVLEGVDASGKDTQAKKLVENLTAMGYKVKHISFPNYSSPASFMIKEYLAGKFGDKAEDIPAKVASTFFAIDRYYSYHEESGWGEALDRGEIVVADRYISSNMVHQCSKLNTIEEKEDFIMWLKEYEYGLYNLPHPDMTIFLDMPPEYGAKLMEGRPLKNTCSKDIHENNAEYLKKSYDNALYVAEHENWTKISCVKNGEILSINEIADTIVNAVKKVL